MAIAGVKSLSPEAASVIDRAADVARLPSAQAEIDRGRLKATLKGAVTLRRGRVTFPPGRGSRHRSDLPARGRGDQPDLRGRGLVPVVLGRPHPAATCRSRSGARHGAARGGGPGRRVAPGAGHLRLPLAAPAARGVGEQLDLPPRSVLVLARGGWTAAVPEPPFGPALASTLAALARTDVREAVPRANWNRRPVDRSPLPPPPPGRRRTDWPRVRTSRSRPISPRPEAYRGGTICGGDEELRCDQARGDGWLLPPEARLDRALCLAGMGKRHEARRILLRTGDSRFENAMDETLERVAPPQPER